MLPRFPQIHFVHRALAGRPRLVIASVTVLALLVFLVGGWAAWFSYGLTAGLPDRQALKSLGEMAQATTILDAADIHNPIVKFVSSPVIALLIGLIGTSFVGRHALGAEPIQHAIATGFKESGQILILTGVGGSLAATIKAAGLGDILGEYFTASTAAPLLVVWVIAAALHVAVGSVTISAITSAGILAPVAPIIGLDPVLIALAAGAGSLFAVHVTSNTFWLLQSLLGQSTRGALKTVTVGVSVASVVAILLILPMSALF